jgi:hypothetical protein
MRSVKLLVFGVLGALGMLRGLELLLVARAISQSVFPLALGLVSFAFFVKEWKKKQTPPSQPETK